MNIKQYWKFFKLAVEIQQNPGGIVVTDDMKVFEITKRRYPNARVLYLRRNAPNSQNKGHKE